MDRIAIVVRLQWRIYWRRVRRGGNLSRNNLGALVLLGGLGVVRYIQQLPLTANQLARGETQKYQALLLLVFLAWMLPVVAESRRSISSRDLLHLPLSTRELFSIRLASVFVSPVSWIVAAGSLALVYPLSRSSNPIGGIVGLLLFVLLALFTSLMVTHLLSNAFMRRIMFVIVIVLSATLGLLWWLQRSTLTRPSSYLSSWLPTKLAAPDSSEMLISLATLAVMNVVVLFIAYWTFMPSVDTGQNHRTRGLSLFSLIELPGPYGGLIKKDLRYSSRLLDVYLVVPIVILFDIYLMFGAEPSAFAFWVVAAILVVPCISLAFNCFGLESPLGLDRYTLFPLSGREILLSKNLSFALLMLLIIGLILPVAIWKLGVVASLIGLLVFVLVGLAYVSIGNWLSVRQPFKMQFYRFASGGSLVDALMGIIFGSLPGAIAIHLLNNEGYGSVWKIALLVLLYAAIYILSLHLSARAFDRRREAIRASVS